MGELAPAEGGDADREHRGGLPERPQAHAPPRGHLGRDAPQARQGQDALPQDRQRQQGMYTVHTATAFKTF